MMRGCTFLQELEIPDDYKPKTDEDLNERLSDVLNLLKEYYEVEKLDSTSAQTSLEKALENCDAIIHQYRVCGEVYLVRGVIYGEKKEWDAAIDDLKNACTYHVPKAEKKLAQVYTKRGDSRKSTQNWQEAYEDYTLAIQSDNTSVNARVKRGELSYNSKNPALLEDSEKDFSEAIKLIPTRASFYFARGVVRDVARKSKDACADFTKALEIDPCNESAFFARGCTYLRHNMFEDAQKDLARALEYCKDMKQKKIIQQVLKYAIVGVPVNPPRIKLTIEETKNT